jgi:hypothetical protein
MSEKLKSRKFWFALLGSVLPIVAQAMTGEVGWDQAVMLSVGIMASYIFGQGYVDGKSMEGTVPSDREIPTSED